MVIPVQEIRRFSLQFDSKILNHRATVILFIESHQILSI